MADQLIAQVGSSAGERSVGFKQLLARQGVLRCKSSRPDWVIPVYQSRCETRLDEGICCNSTVSQNAVFPQS